MDIVPIYFARHDLSTDLNTVLYDIKYPFLSDHINVRRILANHMYFAQMVTNPYFEGHNFIRYDISDHKVSVLTPIALTNELIKLFISFTIYLIMISAMNIRQHFTYSTIILLAHPRNPIIVRTITLNMTMHHIPHLYLTFFYIQLSFQPLHFYLLHLITANLILLTVVMVDLQIVDIVVPLHIIDIVPLHITMKIIAIARFIF